MNSSVREGIQRSITTAPAVWRVHLLATGGTIAGQAASDVEAGYRSGEVGVDTLVAAVPGLRSLAHLRGEQVVQVGSQDMNDGLWLMLAARVNALFKADEADGVVITHGTDTAEETGYFLHLVVKSDRPMVLTGSMRPSTALSADGPLNLYNAVAVAADPESRGRGAIVAINDDLHSARDVTKSNTTDVQTFISPGPGLLEPSATDASAISAAHRDGIRPRRSSRSMVSNGCRGWTFSTPAPTCQPTWCAPALRSARAGS